MLGRIRKLLERRRASAGTGESDVVIDPQVARSRAIGGGGTVDADSAGTTGTGRNDTFVGRVAGEDLGSTGETGAERRARAGGARDPTQPPHPPDDAPAPRRPR
ncbi:hypothetical protein CFP66_37030 [Pseudonocardia sp. MH-G8]|nr:hypothetical protein [Pseudonocardia sp. MH-G8]OZM77229.1 hypothetical protein CFP66_37030 [Pseudonocardia sp. MH-G8]